MKGCQSFDISDDEEMLYLGIDQTLQGGHSYLNSESLFLGSLWPAIKKKEKFSKRGFNQRKSETRNWKE